jgi:hypothetical protein
MRCRRSPCSPLSTRRRSVSPASPISGSRNATGSPRSRPACREISPGLGREDGDDLLVASDPSLAGRTLPASIDTRADHRMAMSFALAGLKLHGITILESDCVAKTYPGYWRALASLGVALEGDVA